MSRHRLWRWAKNQRSPHWDPALPPPCEPVRFDSELRTAAQIMGISPDQSPHEFAAPSSETGTAA